MNDWIFYDPDVELINKNDPSRPGWYMAIMYLTNGKVLSLNFHVLAKIIFFDEDYIGRDGRLHDSRIKNRLYELNDILDKRILI